MNREEAIERLVDLRVQFQVGIFTREAIDTAIEALSAEAVSREFYEDAVNANHGLAKENSELRAQLESAGAVGEWQCKSLSTGEMFYGCSECGNLEINTSNFCPNCGARMLREDGEEE